MPKRVSSIVSIARVLLLRVFGMGLSLASALGVAYIFGAGILADAFFLVRRLSGMWTVLFDSFTAIIFVPGLVATARTQGLRSVLVRMQKLELWFIVVGITLAVPLWVFPDVIISILAPGFVPEAQDYASLYLILFAVTLPLTLITSLTSAVLSSLRLFTLPVMARLLPRILIVIALIMAPLGIGMTGVVVAAVIGHVAMATVFFFARRKLNTHEDIDTVPELTDDNAPLKEKGMSGRALATTIISVYYVAVTLSESYFAASAGIGAIAILSLGQRISNIGISEMLSSILAVYFTNFSEYAGDKTPDRMISSVRDAIRIGLFFIMPIALVLAALSQPIAQLALANGNFSLDNAILTGHIIIFFAISSLLNVPNSTLETALLSTPGQPIVRHFLFAASSSFAVRIALCIALTPRIGLEAIGYAAIFGPLVMLWFNTRRMGEVFCPVFDASIIRVILVISTASVAAMIVSAAVIYSIGWQGPVLVSLLALCASMLLAAATFIAMCGAFRVTEAQKVIGKLRRTLMPLGLK